MSQINVNTGIAESDRASIANALSQLLADSYTLYLKTHNYHWNVTGPHFGSLHALFEAQYTDLASAVDLVAERIRALGHRAPGSYAEFSARTELDEATIESTKAMEMVAALASDHQTVARAAARVVSVASSGGDEPTAGLATTRQEVHEKAAWMLRSFLE
ncbi:MAG: Dps family protein [Actinomycetes bacterium]